jgi:hypothetical protein
MNITRGCMVTSIGSPDLIIEVRPELRVKNQNPAIAQYGIAAFQATVNSAPAI